MALLNVSQLKALVAIGEMNHKGRFECKATGFLIGFIAHNSKDPAKRTYRIFLVTNRHVFKDKKDVSLRLNTVDGSVLVAKESLFFTNGERKWLAHPVQRVDIALLNISSSALQQNRIDFSIFNEEGFAYLRDFSKHGISIGDELYILGFPMGFAGVSQNYPYVKHGIISRTDAELVKQGRAFLIDSSVFPGNSGGPVVYKPTLESLEGSRTALQTYLIGVVKGYIPYEEELYTHQTNPHTVVSLERENSGLSLVVPMEYVRAIYTSWIKNKKKLESAQKNVEVAQEHMEDKDVYPGSYQK